ncbi:MAG: gephyrin-like molybdotransferase Glp [Myxococcota bacterium]
MRRMLTLEEARQRILDDLAPVGTETVDLLAGAGRVAAEAVIAGRALPAFDNSAMDGYAVRAEETSGATADSPVRLEIVEAISAGSVPEQNIGPGTAARIFTGAPLPPGADAVVMQEATEVDGARVAIREKATIGQHVRRAGEDMSIGDVIVAAGDPVRAGELGVLAGQGRSWIRVFRRPRVAILPTGDELVEIDIEPGPGQITNSNSVSLAAQVREAGGIPHRLPPAPDDVERLAKALADAAAAADLIITSGGVSVGELDLVRNVLGQSGAMDFWRVAIKPGKPLAYGRLHGRPLIGLPGNPVSTFVCFELFARPALRKLAGCPGLFRPAASARLATAVRRNAKRREFLRGRLARRDGELWVEPAAKQGSGQLSSMLGVDALIDLAAGDGGVAAGEAVDVLILDSSSAALSQA